MQFCVPAKVFQPDQSIITIVSAIGGKLQISILCTVIPSRIVIISSYSQPGISIVNYFSTLK